MTIEYCVMMRRFLDAPHRGPWPLEECEEWVQEAEDDGCLPGAFYVARREVSPWEKF